MYTHKIIIRKNLLWSTTHNNQELLANNKLFIQTLTESDIYYNNMITQ